jgi:phosphonate transport system substrate-binding protein
VHSRQNARIELLVQPVFQEGLSYRCLFLVPADSPFRTVEDLRGTVMAMTDRESNTGCLVPCAMLAGRGHNPATYFRKLLFTGSHDRSILAVARNVVDVAAVDALVWESNRRTTPALAEQVRVIWQSEVFGPPPIVVPVGLDPALKESLRQALLAMHEDDQGKQILAAIGIRRFVPADPASYESAVSLLDDLRRHGGVPWP